MNTTHKTAGRRFLLSIVPVMFCFFAMGFVDLVGTASNYVQRDLGLSDSEANVFPSLVFFWFLIFSVPTGMLMNRIGRKNTVLISLAVTAVSLFVPTIGDSYAVMFASFSLLGIGNALMQTSLNPLVTNLISGDKLASTLTFGQFVKAIASFLAPVLAAWGATTAFPTLGMGWKMLFLVYAVVSVIAILLLFVTPIAEEAPDKASGFVECLRLLGSPIVLLCFLGILCHVGIDVGTNTTAPKLMTERMGLPLEEAGYATSVYFVLRTLGCLTGAFALRMVPHRGFFAVSALMILAGVLILFWADDKAALYTGIGLIGFGNSNVFSIVLSQALLAMPDAKNAVSGLMIMGLFGGTLFPLSMGFASDAMGQAGAVAVMLVGALYLLLLTSKIKKTA